jgi:type I restriction enzyme S subunit
MRETGWRRTRLKYLASAEAGTWGEEPGEAGEDVHCIRAADFDRQRLRVAQDRIPVRSVESGALARLALRPGDIVLEKSGGGPDQPVGGSVLFDLGISAVCSNFAARLRPAAGVDPRFLNYLMASMYHRGVTASLAKQTTGIANLDMGAYMAFACTVPREEDQGTIAEYLDAETARLDAVIATLSAANSLLGQWLSSQIESLMWSETPELVPLMRLTCDARQIQYGIVLPGPDVEDGVPIVKGGNLLSGVLQADGLANTTYEIEAGYGRSRLEAGDIAFAIRGAVGACAIVPPEVAGANITQDVAMIAHTSEVDPTWLLFALRSTSAQSQAEARILGATIQGINIRDLKRLKLPRVDLRVQRDTADELVRAQSHHDSLVSARTAQINLLKERRQALITDAVTGQIEIPRVAA